MPKSSAKKRRARPFLWGALLLFLILGSGVLTLWKLSRPTGLPRVQEVRIEPGMNARAIGQLLVRHNLVHNARLFEWTARLQDKARHLEAGLYRLDGRLSTPQLVNALLQAPIQTRRVTIPEGLTRQAIGGLLQAHGLVDSARFVRLTADRDLIDELGLAVPTLEGYLFPETYFFDPETSEKAVITRLVTQFKRIFTDSLQTRLGELDLTQHQALTLASIVEGEAQKASERPLISGVFHRRLQLGRRLESCATVEYALGVHKARLTNADLEVVSPFNTYRHAGLPPAPICNPGRLSIMATLYPTQTNYLYFVARGDGGHIFSRTNREHERAKRAVRRQQAAN